MLTSIHHPSCAAHCAGGIISISVIQFFTPVLHMYVLIFIFFI